MIQDLSTRHDLVGNLVSLPATPQEWARYRLSPEQVRFFHDNGYVAGVRILDDSQVDALRAELQDLYDPNHPANGLFHEFHTNESPDPARVLFHALGASRIRPGFHDILWHPAFTVAAAQLLDGPVPLLARSTLLQAGPARRHRGLAPGLFVLDAHNTDGSSDLLDRPRRRHARQRLSSLSARQSSLAAAAGHRPGRRHGRHPSSADAGPDGPIRPPRCHRAEKGRGDVSPSAHGSRLLRQRHRSSTPRHCHQRLPRRYALMQRSATAPGRSRRAAGSEDGRAVLPIVVRSRRSIVPAGR